MLVEIETKDVAHASGIGDEVQEPTIGGPLRVGVRAMRRCDWFDCSGGYIEQRKGGLTERERGQIAIARQSKARVDQDTALRALHEHAGMAEISDAHAATGEVREGKLVTGG